MSAAFSLFGSSSRPVNARGGGGSSIGWCSRGADRAGRGREGRPALWGAGPEETAGGARPEAASTCRGACGLAREAGAGPGAGWGLGTQEGLPGAQRNAQRIVLLHQGIFFMVNEMSLRNRTRHTLNMQGTSRREACMTSEARTELTENSSSLVGDRHSGSWAGSARSGLPSAPCAARPARKDGHPRGSRLEHLRRKALPRTTPANRWLETPAWAAVVRDGAVRELKGHTALVLVRLSPLQMPPH